VDPVVNGVRISVVEGSFQVNNSLSDLGFNVTVHPFFSEMRLFIRASGARLPPMLDAIADCIGGKVVAKNSKPPTYEIQPNVEEIRTRAIATVELFYPSNPQRLFADREVLHAAMLKNLSNEDMKQWIDAANKRKRMPVIDQQWAQAVRQYRTLYFDEMEKLRNGKPGKYTRDEFMSMAVYLEFAENLTFGIVLVDPHGAEYWL
jgi:hypothetical protein